MCWNLFMYLVFSIIPFLASLDRHVMSLFFFFFLIFVILCPTVLKSSLQHTRSFQRQWRRNAPSCGPCCPRPREKLLPRHYCAGPAIELPLRARRAGRGKPNVTVQSLETMAYDQSVGKFVVAMSLAKGVDADQLLVSAQIDSLPLCRSTERDTGPGHQAQARYPPPPE